MRYRWDPPYPMGHRGGTPADTGLRASDDERNAVADTLSRHYAEGRLDEAEFKTRLDAAMSAKTRGDLHGLFHDLPRLPAPAPPPPTPRQRAVPWLLLFAFVALVTVASLPFSPWDEHVPWFLFVVVGFFLWRRAARGPWHHHHDGGESRPASAIDH